MSKLKYEIVHDAKTVKFQPSPKKVSFPEDKESPLLKRRAPKRPEQKTKPVQTDE